MSRWSRPGNPAGVTPTIVNGRPAIVSVRPSTSSEVSKLLPPEPLADHRDRRLVGSTIGGCEQPAPDRQRPERLEVLGRHEGRGQRHGARREQEGNRAIALSRNHGECPAARLLNGLEVVFVDGLGRCVPAQADELGPFGNARQVPEDQGAGD